VSVAPIKTVLAFILVAVGLASAGTMLSVLGRGGGSGRLAALKRAHHVLGYLFVALLAVLAVLGATILARAGDGLSLRGVIHWVLGALLVIVIALKILIARFYKKLLRFVPALGLMVIVLALLTAVVSCCFFIVASHGAYRPAWAGRPAASEAGSAAVSSGQGSRSVGDALVGELLFDANCSVCHSAGGASGPTGLMGLFEREVLVSSGAAVTGESVRAQILRPVGAMPSFEGRLVEEEIDDLIAYLESL
jgi:mono/diheme cytochrome c family protein